MGSYRSAEKKDLDAVVRMGRNLHAESRFAYMPFSEERALRTMGYCQEIGYLMLYVDTDDTLLGFMAGISGPKFFSDAIEAVELCLWLEPAARKSGIAGRMIGMFAEWAKSKGAVEACGGSTGGLNADVLRLIYGQVDFTPVGELFVRRF